jgi:hypothetical protein
MLQVQMKEVGIRKKESLIRERESEACLIAAEASIMGMNLEKVPSYLKAYYIKMQHDNAGDSMVALLMPGVCIATLYYFLFCSVLNKSYNFVSVMCIYSCYVLYWYVLENNFICID